MLIKLDKRRIFNILFAGLFLLMMLRYSFSLEIPRIVLTVLVAVMAAVGGKDEIVAVFMSLIPLHNAIDFYIAIMLCIVVFIVKYYRDVRIGNFVILAGAMIAWELLHCYFFMWTPTMLFAAIVPVVYITVFMSTDTDGVDYSFIVRTMSVVSIYMCLLFLVNIIVNSGFNLSEAFINVRRLGMVSDEEMLIGGAINPNALGIVNVLCMTTLMQLRTVGDKKKSDIVLIVLLMMFGLLTLSRTFLVCLFIMFIFIVFGQGKGIKSSIYVFACGILVAALTILITSILFPDAIRSFIGRFEHGDITSGRGVIMRDYHEYFRKNEIVAFFGVGMSDLSEKVVNVYSISTHVPHNSMQEILVAWGIPGLFMVGVLIVMMVAEARKRGKRNLLNYAPLAIILAKSMAGQLLTSGYTLIALTLAYLSLCQDFSGTENS